MILNEILIAINFLKGITFLHFRISSFLCCVVYTEGTTAKFYQTRKVIENYVKNWHFIRTFTNLSFQLSVLGP